MKFKAVLSEAIAFIFPVKCVCCSEIIQNQIYICEKCIQKAERMSEKICKWCGLERKQCECNFHTYRFRGTVAPFKNEGYIKDAFYAFKFHRRISNSRFFSKEMVACVKKHYPDIKFDAVCAVPMYYFDKADRGYNQSEILARQISKMLSIGYDGKALYSHKKKKEQHKTKGIAARYENIKGRYYFKKKNSYENVLLVDDIKTTGATLDECARQLMLAGANNVYCVTALITNPRLKKEKKRDIIKNKSGDKNGN